MKTVLVIIDGAGLAEFSLSGNAVTPDTLPTWHAAMQENGFAVLEASGPAVGLDEGQAGNSEVGHMTIGAGFVVPSMLKRIEIAHENGEWAGHPLWQELASHSRLHLVGLLSEAGTHGHWRSIVASARLASAAGVPEIVVHTVLDGVDSPAGSAPDLLALLTCGLAGIAGVRMGLVTGRATFCDRSGNLAVSEQFSHAMTGLSDLPKFDPEHLQRHLATASEASFPPHRHDQAENVAPGEPVLLTQNRADRAVQVAAAIGASQNVYSLVALDGAVPTERVFFPARPLDKGLGFELKARDVSSVRIAERCKFPHVTYFLNGLNPGLEGSEICLPSVPEAEMSLHPEMSASLIADAVLDALEADMAQLIVVNIANLDQIGHLGNYGLAVSAARSVEAALKRIAEAAKLAGACLVITSDHGNADCVTDETGRPFGSHTVAPVPFAILPPHGHAVEWQGHEGSLARIAPTVLCILGIQSPGYMAEPLARLI